MNENDPENADEEALPARLVAALARLDEPDVNIPASVDARILSRAKADYARRMRFRQALRWVAAIGSVAAAIAVVFVLRATLRQPAVHLARGDINASGKVDMLDAYSLARKIANGEKLDPKWDVNGDGVIDQADVDWIAEHAVQIAPGNGSDNAQ